MISTHGIGGRSDLPASPQPDSPRAVAIFVTGYAVTHAVAGAVFGPRWFDRADTFEVYAGLLAALSPIGTDAEGRVVLRTPSAGLHGGRADAGQTSLALVVLGGTMYDGLSRLSVWSELIRAVGQPSTTLLTTAALGAVIAANPARLPRRAADDQAVRPHADRLGRRVHALARAHRNLLFAAAYDILGSVTDAEDVVQDAWLRWEWSTTRRSSIRART